MGLGMGWMRGDLPLAPDAAAGQLPAGRAGRHGKYGQMTELAIPAVPGRLLQPLRRGRHDAILFDDLVYDIENNRKFEFGEGRNFRRRSDEHGYFEAVGRLDDRTRN